MITGNPSIFAIEPEISQAFERLSSLGLGSFTIRIKSLRYGRYEPNATLLGCSPDEVQRRLRDRRNHVTHSQKVMRAQLLMHSENRSTEKPMEEATLE